MISCQEEYIDFENRPQTNMSFIDSGRAQSALKVRPLSAQNNHTRDHSFTITSENQFQKCKNDIIQEQFPVNGYKRSQNNQSPMNENFPSTTKQSKSVQNQFSNEISGRLNGGKLQVVTNPHENQAFYQNRQLTPLTSNSVQTSTVINTNVASQWTDSSASQLDEMKNFNPNMINMGSNNNNINNNTYEGYFSLNESEQEFFQTKNSNLNSLISNQKNMTSIDDEQNLAPPDYEKMLLMKPQNKKLKPQQQKSKYKNYEPTTQEPLDASSSYMGFFDKANQQNEKPIRAKKLKRKSKSPHYSPNQSKTHNISLNTSNLAGLNLQEKKEINQMIMNTIQKKQAEIMFKQNVEEKEKRMKQQKKLEIQIKNEFIRLQNLQRFSKLGATASNQTKPKPWNYDQRQKTNNTSTMRDQLQPPQRNNKSRLDDRQRRDLLGLSFLNEVDTEQYTEIVKKNKGPDDYVNEYVHQGDGKPMKDETQKHEIRNFMENQQKRDVDSRMQKERDDIKKQDQMRKNKEKLYSFMVQQMNDFQKQLHIKKIEQMKQRSKSVNKNRPGSSTFDHSFYNAHQPAGFINMDNDISNRSKQTFTSKQNRSVSGDLQRDDGWRSNNNFRSLTPNTLSTNTGRKKLQNNTQHNQSFAAAEYDQGNENDRYQYLYNQYKKLMEDLENDSSGFNSRNMVHNNSSSVNQTFCEENSISRPASSVKNYPIMKSQNSSNQNINQILLNHQQKPFSISPNPSQGQYSNQFSNNNSQQNISGAPPISNHSRSQSRSASRQMEERKSDLLGKYNELMQRAQRLSPSFNKEMEGRESSMRNNYETNQGNNFNQLNHKTEDGPEVEEYSYQQGGDGFLSGVQGFGTSQLKPFMFVQGQNDNSFRDDTEAEEEEQSRNEDHNIGNGTNNPHFYDNHKNMENNYRENHHSRNQKDYYEDEVEIGGESPIYTANFSLKGANFVSEHSYNNGVDNQLPHFPLSNNYLQNVKQSVDGKRRIESSERVYTSQTEKFDNFGNQRELMVEMPNGSNISGVYQKHVTTNSEFMDIDELVSSTYSEKNYMNTNNSKSTIEKIRNSMETFDVQVNKSMDLHQIKRSRDGATRTSEINKQNIQKESLDILIKESISKSISAQQIVTVEDEEEIKNLEQIRMIESEAKKQTERLTVRDQKSEKKGTLQNNLLNQLNANNKTENSSNNNNNNRAVVEAKELNFKKKAQPAILTHDEKIAQIKKIQQVWRNFQTQKLVSSYAAIFASGIYDEEDLILYNEVNKSVSATGKAKVENQQQNKQDDYLDYEFTVTKSNELEDDAQQKNAKNINSQSSRDKYGQSESRNKHYRDHQFLNESESEQQEKHGNIYENRGLGSQQEEEEEQEEDEEEEQEYDEDEDQDGENDEDEDPVNQGMMQGSEDFEDYEQQVQLAQELAKLDPSEVDHDLYLRLPQKLQEELLKQFQQKEEELRAKVREKEIKMSKEAEAQAATQTNNTMKDFQQPEKIDFTQLQNSNQPQTNPVPLNQNQILLQKQNEILVIENNSDNQNESDDSLRSFEKIKNEIQANSNQQTNVLPNPSSDINQLPVKNNQLNPNLVNVHNINNQISNISSSNNNYTIPQKNSSKFSSQQSNAGNYMNSMHTEDKQKSSGRISGKNSDVGSQKSAISDPNAFPDANEINFSDFGEDIPESSQSEVRYSEILKKAENQQRTDNTNFKQNRNQNNSGPPLEVTIKDDILSQRDELGNRDQPPGFLDFQTYQTPVSDQGFGGSERNFNSKPQPQPNNQQVQPLNSKKNEKEAVNFGPNSEQNQKEEHKLMSLLNKQINKNTIDNNQMEIQSLIDPLMNKRNFEREIQNEGPTFNNNFKDTLILNEINDHTKSLITVKDFDSEFDRDDSKSHNQYGTIESKNRKTQNSVNRLDGRTQFSEDQNQLQIMDEMAMNAQSYQFELAQLREDQLNQWNDMIKILSHMETDGNMGMKAAQLMKVLKDQSENNQRFLQENFPPNNLVSPASGAGESLMAEVEQFFNMNSNNNSDFMSSTQQRYLKPISGENYQQNFTTQQREEEKNLVKGQIRHDNNSFNFGDDTGNHGRGLIGGGGSTTASSTNKSQTIQAGLIGNEYNNYMDINTNHPPAPPNTQSNNITSNLNNINFNNQITQQQHQQQIQNAKQKLMINVDKIEDQFFGGNNNDSNTNNNFITSSNIADNALLIGDNDRMQFVNTNTLTGVRDSSNRAFSESNEKNRTSKEFMTGQIDFSQINFANNNLAGSYDQIYNLRELTPRTSSVGQSTPSRMDNGPDIPFFSMVALSQDEALNSYRDDPSRKGGKSIFSENPSLDFSKKNVKEMLKKENMVRLLKVREEALDQRHQEQQRIMKKLFDNNRISPQSFNAKRLELDKWVSKEKENIKKTKNEIQQSWMRTYDTIQRTQRDLQFIETLEQRRSLPHSATGGLNSSLKNVLADGGLKPFSYSEDENTKLEKGIKAAQEQQLRKNRSNGLIFRSESGSETDGSLSANYFKFNDFVGTPESNGGGTNIMVIDEYKPKEDQKGKDQSKSSDNEGRIWDSQLEIKKNQQNSLIELDKNKDFIDEVPFESHFNKQRNIYKTEQEEDDEVENSIKPIIKKGSDQIHSQNPHPIQGKSLAQDRSLTDLGNNTNNNNNANSVVDPRAINQDHFQNKKRNESQGSANNSGAVVFTGVSDDFQEIDFEESYCSGMGMRDSELMGKIKQSINQEISNYSNVSNQSNFKVDSAGQNKNLENKQFVVGGNDARTTHSNKTQNEGKNNQQFNGSDQMMGEEETEFFSEHQQNIQKGSIPGASYNNYIDNENDSVSYIDQDEIILEELNDSRDQIDFSTKQQGNFGNTMHQDLSYKDSSNAQLAGNQLNQPKNPELTSIQDFDNTKPELLNGGNGKQQTLSQIQPKSNKPKYFEKTTSIIEQKDTQPLIQDLNTNKDDQYSDDKEIEPKQHQKSKQSASSIEWDKDFESYINSANNPFFNLEDNNNNNNINSHITPQKIIGQNRNQGRPDETESKINNSKGVGNSDVSNATNQRDLEKSQGQVVNKNLSFNSLLIQRPNSADKLTELNYSSSRQDPASTAEQFVGGRDEDDDFFDNEFSENNQNTVIQLSNIISNLQTDNNNNKTKVEDSQSAIDSSEIKFKEQAKPIVPNLTLDDTLDEDTIDLITRDQSSEAHNRTNEPVKQYQSASLPKKNSPFDSDDSEMEPVAVNNALSKQKMEEELSNKERQFGEKLLEVTQTRQKNEKTDIITDNILERVLYQFENEIQMNILALDQLREKSKNNLSPELPKKPLPKPLTNSQDKQQPRGIKTNLSAVKQYLSRLSQFIQDTYRKQFLKHINISLGPRPLEMLKFLHFNDFSGSQSLESSSDSIYQHQAVMTTELYAELEKKIIEEKNLKLKSEGGDNLPRNTRTDFFKELEHIHNKVIFDSFNQALDWFRVYGLKGRPFPWKVTAFKISEKPIPEPDVPKILDRAIEKVVDWSSSLCGIIFDQEDSPFSHHMYLDEDYVSQIKEDRLARMLANEVIQTQDRWITYDDQHTEVMVELSDLVFDRLMNETVDELVSVLFKKYKQNDL